MNTRTIKKSLGSTDDLLLNLAETSARTVLAVEAMRQRANQRLQAVAGADGLAGLRLPSTNVDWLEAMRPASQTVRSSVADQLANSGDVAVLERTTALLGEHVKLIARLSRELAEERRRRRAAESAMADLQGQVAELEQNLCADVPDPASEDGGAVGTAPEPHETAEMESQARDWRRRSSKRPRSARRWLRRNARKLLRPLAAT